MIINQKLGINSIMDRLRELWRQGDWKEFDRLYSLGKWWISKEDQQKIEVAIEMRKVRHKPPEQQKCIKMVLDEFPGSKIIE